MKPFNNKKKQNFLSNIPQTSIESDTDKLTKRCKFNFHYMDFSQGQNFTDWQPKLSKLLDKLKNYSGESLNYWRKERIGKKGHVLEVYKNFPSKSKFKHPKFVPHEAHWARFRLEWNDRLIGFVLPSEYSEKKHHKTKIQFDCNTFYIVFLDENHDFYKT